MFTPNGIVWYPFCLSITCFRLKNISYSDCKITTVPRLFWDSSSFISQVLLQGWQLLVSACLARGRRVGLIFLGHGSQLTYPCVSFEKANFWVIVFFIQILRESATKKGEVPGLGGKDNFRLVDWISLSGKECLVVTLLRLQASKQWQKVAESEWCIPFYSTKKKSLSQETTWVVSLL